MAYDEYLSAGVHIGMKQRTKDMKGFIFKIRPDGLAVMDVQKIDERIKLVAKFISGCKKIMIVSRKSAGFKPIVKFAEILEKVDKKCVAITGRFLPGIITNPSFRHYVEPDVLITTDPLVDGQAMNEAAKMRIPIISLCDTFNETKDTDIVIPCNNKGKKSIAVVYWLLARETLKELGKLQKDSDFEYKPDDFEMKEVIREFGGKREQEEGRGGRSGGSRGGPSRGGGMDRRGGGGRRPRE